MLLPMFGLLLALLVVSALATLVAVGDPRHARLAPYVGFTSLFAGVGAIALLLCFGLLGGALDSLFGTGVLGFVGFVGGCVLGLAGGALLGLIKAFRRGHP